MAHAREKLALDLIGGQSFFVGMAQIVIEFPNFRFHASTFLNLQFQRIVRERKFGLAFGDFSGFSPPAQARADQDDIFKDNPSRVFDPTKGTFDEDTKHGLRPPDSAQKVIRRDDECRRHDHSPVPIKS